MGLHPVWGVTNKPLADSPGGFFHVYNLVAGIVE
jgi:hypothetical protein